MPDANGDHWHVYHSMRNRDGTRKMWLTGDAEDRHESYEAGYSATRGHRGYRISIKCVFGDECPAPLPRDAEELARKRRLREAEARGL